MSNLLKSKFLLGAMTFAVMFVGVAALNATPAAADCSITSTLRLGSKGDQVVCLQMSLGGLTPDGSFGPKTRDAVMVFQSNSSLTPDGVFGPKSRSVWMANQFTGNFPAGCNSAVGFSNTTGQPCFAIPSASFPAGCTSSLGFSPTTGASCATGVSTTVYPAGCASNSGFSATTGLPCTGGPVTLPSGCATASGFSSTTGQPCTATTTVSGTNGYLTDIASDSTNRVSTVYESEQDRVVAGFRATARLSSQKVDRVRVQMRNTDNGGSSLTLGKYISSASLWLGSTKIATMAIANADRSTSDDTYTFNFSGLNANIAQDQIGHFYVSVSANGSLDSTDATNANWAVTFPDGGVSATSPDGSSDTYNASSGNVGTLLGTNVGFTFGKFSANGVKATVGLSATNPNATIVGVNATSAVNNVTILKFTVKATNSNLTLRKIPVQVVTTGANVSAIVNTIRIYNGANVVDSADGSAGVLATGGVITSGACTTSCGFIFSNLSTPANTIASEATSEFSVVVDLKSQAAGPFADGSTITASVANGDVLLVANFGVYDTNGDQIPAGSTYRLGSAIGTVQSLYVNGVNTVMGTPTYSTQTASNGDITSVSYTIPLTVTAFGNDLYIGQTTQLAATATASGAVAFVFQNAASSYGDETVVTASHTITSTGSCAATANVLGTGFLLPSGTSRCFTVNVTLTGPTTLNTFYRVQLKQIRTFTDAGLGLGAASTNLLPVDAFRTGTVFINN